MNNVFITGRLTANPDMKITKTGHQFVRFIVAVDKPYKKDTVDEDKKAFFISCIIWGKPAEYMSSVMEKGDYIAVQGYILTGSYTKQDGTTAYTTDINVSNFDKCGKKTVRTEQEPQDNGFVACDDNEDDLPF